jgi:outer membrane protein assembly factor BamD
MGFTRIRGTVIAAVLLLSLSGCAGNDLPVDAAPADILTYAEAKLAKGKYVDAIEGLEHLVRSYPGTKLIPRAKLRLGDAHYGIEEYVLARAEYEDVVEDYPASPFVEEARFKIARCSYAGILRYDLDPTETEQAIRLLRDFRRDYPNSSYLAEADAALADCRDRLARREYVTGRFYEKRHRFRSAKIEYEFVRTNYPETAWATKAALRLGEIFRSREEWDTARSWYRIVLQEAPDSDEADAARAALAELPGAGEAS